MSAKQQVQFLEDHIGVHIRHNEGVGDCAIRMLKGYRDTLVRIMRELGVPNEGYPAPIANAYEMAEKALRGYNEVEHVVDRRLVP